MRGNKRDVYMENFKIFEMYKYRERKIINGVILFGENSIDWERI